MRSPARWIVLALLLAASPAAGAPPPPPRPPVYLGGQFAEISGWTPAVYANQFMQGRGWLRPGTLDPLPADQLDARGNPRTDGRLLFLEGKGAGPDAVVAGTYKLSFRGQARLRIGDAGTIENQAYDKATNTTTADVILPRAGTNYWIDFTDAWRRGDHAADASGNTRGITEARLMSPGHSWPADFWRKEVHSLANGYSLMRLMTALGPSGGGCNNQSGVMTSCDTTWDTRSRPGFYGYAMKGMPWEDTVVLSNLTGMDIWVNIPIGATNDYVTRVFQLLRHGSDGDLPYTKPTQDPTTWRPGDAWYPGLLPGRKVYVEFTNELFSYYRYGDPQGQAEIAAGDPHHLAYDGKRENPGDRWGAWNTVRLSLLAREVWGDAAMQDTIRIVYANQGNWGGWARHKAGLDYIVNVWGPRSPYATIDGFTVPRKPVSWYIHNISGSFYLHSLLKDGVPTATTVGTLGTMGVLGDGSGFFGELKRALSVKGGNQQRWELSIDDMHALAEATAERYGVKFSSYETGIEIFKPGAVGAAWSDPQMRTLYHDLLTRMRARRNSDVPVQSATVRGVYPTNELSKSWAAADGFPWPLTGTPAPTPMWQAMIDVSQGR
jgi:hypothetical protein